MIEIDLLKEKGNRKGGIEFMRKPRAVSNKLVLKY